MPVNTDDAQDQTDTGATDDTATADVSAADQSTDAPAGADDAGTTDGADALGDAGKRALDSMKGKWRDERDKRRALEERLAKLEAGNGSGDTDQPDPDAIRREAAREATAKANSRILKSEVKAAAAGKLADPADALVYLDLASFEVGEDGEIDADEISEAISELLTRKPYLAAKAVRFQGSGDGGAARKASGPSQLTREDLKGMSPEAIRKAKADGRLKDLLTGK